MPCVGCEKDCKCTTEKCCEGCKCREPGKCGCNASKPSSGSGGCCNKGATDGTKCCGSDKK
ncbi:uncharacterized protein Dwil_GK12122 [Drosophila willistoni]|uniref:Uncharacterized protein n=1 Tax=Drosophila willistoni TaxID=7260 RepID=B4N8U2_DROWI|nr:metallothionein-3 [Drosophila willistoni]EDW81543.1 uncharacterized protein Dwil_GK12122 [Drosophila willistoni]